MKLIMLNKLFWKNILKNMLIAIVILNIVIYFPLIIGTLNFKHLTAIETKRRIIWGIMFSIIYGSCIGFACTRVFDNKIKNKLLVIIFAAIIGTIVLIPLMGFGNGGVFIFSAGILMCGFLAQFVRNTSDDEELRKLGMKKVLNGNHMCAIEYYNQAIKITPENTEAVYLRGRSYLLLGNYEQAIIDFSCVLNKKPDDIDAFNNRGMVYYLLERYDEAINDFSSALNINNKSISNYIDRASAYGKKGAYDLAIEDYKSALEIDINNEKAYNNLGNIYSLKGLYDQAIDVYTKALKITPSGEAYHNRGLAYVAKDDYEKALKDFKNAKKLGVSIDKNLYSKIISQI